MFLNKMQYIGCGIGLCGLYLGYRYGVINYIKNGYKQIKLLTQLINNIEKVNNLPHDNNLELGDNYAMITYTHNANVYKIYIPFDRMKAIYMSDIKMHLEDDDQTIDITQEPGIPYLLSPSMIGRTSSAKIIAHNISNNKTHTYVADEIPLFCNDVLDDDE